MLLLENDPLRGETCRSFDVIYTSAIFRRYGLFVGPIYSTFPLWLVLAPVFWISGERILLLVLQLYYLHHFKSK